MDLRTVLAVDDNADSLDLMDEVLSEEGFHVLRARSATEALAILLGNRVDLVLLDLIMPDMNGFALLEIIRLFPRLVDMVVLVQTAHGDGYDVMRAKDLGAAGVLHKPISSTMLAATVREVLANRRGSAATARRANEPGSAARARLAPAV